MRRVGKFGRPRLRNMISSLLRRVAAPTPTRLAAAAAAVSFSAAAAAASCLSTGAGATAGSGMSAQQYVDALGLIAHPEGGYFRETFRAGSVPMSTKGKTDESADLMPTPSRAGSRRWPFGDFLDEQFQFFDTPIEGAARLRIESVVVAIARRPADFSRLVMAQVNGRAIGQLAGR